MKEIHAVVQASKVQKIHDTFHQMKGFPGISAARVDWFAPHTARPKTAKEELTDSSKKTLLTILAPDELVENIIGMLVDCTYTGQPSDGVIWVTSAEQVIQICEARGGSSDPLPSPPGVA
jgi:nitrogen regulatory protein P-II 1